MVSSEFLRPELPADPPWRRCLYCSHLQMWEGSLPFCAARQQVLSLEAALESRCNSWTPGETVRQPNSWCPPLDTDEARN